MATITSAGLGSGLDVTSIVSQLTELERAPIKQLQTEASSLQTKVSSLGSLKSALSTLSDASAKLKDPNTWTATTATSSDSTALTVSTDSTAATGSYSIGVQNLASAQATASAVFANSGAVIGIGTLSFEIGSYNGSLSTFATNPNWPKANVEITSGDNTLEKVRDKINSAGVGVLASVVTDATGSRLVLRSSATGTANGFKVTVQDGDGNNTDAGGLSALAYDPTTQVTDANGVPRALTNMTATQKADNARVSINGLNIESATNTITGAVEGLTFKASKVTANPVDVSVAQDTESIKKAVTAFATAYTSLNSVIKDQTKYDATNKKGAALQGDSAVIGIQSRMRAILTQSSGASSVYQQLSQIGLSPDATGALTVNSTKLSAALSSNLSDVKKLFANADAADSSKDGFASRFKALADEVTGFEGTLTTRTDGLQKRISDNTKRQAALEDRVALYKKRLTQQYNTLDTNMAKINGLSSYVSQQLAALSNSSS
jgi:flagellar hook-associated protein 2